MFCHFYHFINFNFFSFSGVDDIAARKRRGTSRLQGEIDFFKIKLNSF
jgi:hypothetical protein